MNRRALTPLPLLAALACPSTPPAGPAVVDPDTSQLFVDRPTGVAAVGEDFAVVTVLARNTFFEPVANRPVQFAVRDVAGEDQVVNLQPTSAELDASGTARCRVSASEPVTVTISVIADAVPLSQEVTVEFVWPELNQGCTTTADLIACPLETGGHAFELTSDDTGVEHLALTNATGVDLQVDLVSAYPATLEFDGELCAYLDLVPTEHDVIYPGEGEVGCAHRFAGEPFIPLQWNSNNPDDGLRVPDGSTVYVYAEYALILSRAVHVVTVVAREEVAGVSVLKSPYWSDANECDGSRVATIMGPGEVWTNLESDPWTIVGATLLAWDFQAAATQVDEWCLYIYNPSAEVRVQECHTDARQGPYPIDLTYQVQPHETIAAQAFHTCPLMPGDSWHWAAYLYRE